MSLIVVPSTDAEAFLHRLGREEFEAAENPAARGAPQRQAGSESYTDSSVAPEKHLCAGKAIGIGSEGGGLNSLRPLEEVRSLQNLWIHDDISNQSPSAHSSPSVPYRRRWHLGAEKTSTVHSELAIILVRRRGV